MKNRKRVLVTAGLPYSNGRLHVGHIAGAYLPSDIYVRFLKLQKVPTLYICGSDDHGVAIMLAAEKEGKTPQEVATYYNQKQHQAFSGLGINFDIYSSTSTNKYHYQTSQEFFKTLHSKGFFEKQVTKQFFDDSRSMFLPDRFVKGTCGFCGTKEQNGDQCESCGKMLDVDTLKDALSIFSNTPASIKETSHWFLDLSQFDQNVKDWLATAKLREHSRSYVNGLLSTGLVKRSMTRDISWGIPVPLEDPEAKGKVLYVWFDAPIGYVSNTMEVCEERFGAKQDYEKWWKGADSEIYHFIGEDNTVFHCVIWIAMLKAEGSFNLPNGVIVNQYLNIKFPGKEEEKISKSRGTAVWIEDYLADGGNPDSLRYYLTSIAPERARSAYQPEDLIQRHNSELANVLGNFVNRVISFTINNYGPEIPVISEDKLNDFDKIFNAQFLATHSKLTELLENFSFKAALESIMEFARICNKYIDDQAPWISKKTDAERTKTTMAYGLNAIHALAVWLSPFLPFTAEKIAHMLNLDATSIVWEDALRPQQSGSKINAPVILFEKIK